MNVRLLDLVARTVAAVALPLCLLSLPAVAAPGDLLPTFGNGGKVLGNFSVNDSGVNAVVVSGGKVILAGYAVIGSGSDFGVARLNADGSLDQGFGTNGHVTIDFNLNDIAFALAVQSDGKIVVAGGAGGSGGFSLARLNADGTLDATFGTSGKVLTPPSNFDAIRAIAIQPDGKIVAAGYANINIFVMARYNADGTIDNTFGCATPGTCAGKFTTSVGGSFQGAYAVGLQSDGKIVAAGRSGDNLVDDFALVRYNANGTIDDTFGCATPGTCTGIVKTSFGPNRDEARAVLIQPDGKIVAGGYTRVSGTNYDFALARYETNGLPDTTFGLAGKLTTDMGGDFAQINALALQPDGRIVAVGQVSAEPTSADFAMARYEPDGFFDLNFGCATPGSCTGIVKLALTNQQDYATALALQADGKVVAAVARQIEAYKFDMAILRFNANGTADPTYGSAGRSFVAFGGSADKAHALARTSTRLYAAGSTGTVGSEDFAIAGYLLEGAPDPAFGVNGTGRTAVDVGGGTDVATSVLVQPDGKVLLVGLGYNVSTYDFALARVLADGSPDTSFGISGRVLTGVGTGNDEAHAAVLQPDGKFVAAGFASSGAAVDFALARYNATGSLDTSFNTTGKVITSFPAGNSGIEALALQADGKIVAAGSAGSAPQLMALARYNANGSLDTSFGCPTPGTCSGKVTLAAGSTLAAIQAVKVLGDGRIVAVGEYVNASGKLNLVAARFNGDGTLDNAFGTTGVTTIAVGVADSLGLALDVDASGNLVISGNAANLAGNTDAIVVRLRPGGALDTGFGAGGIVVVPFGLNSEARAIMVLPSTEIVIGGWAISTEYSGSMDFMLASLDGTASPAVSASRDLSGDGKSDVLLRGPAGEVVAWLMNGDAITAATLMLGGGTGYEASQFGDFNGDGKKDLLVTGPTGELVVWLMNGDAVTSSTLILGGGTGYVVDKLGDFNGDGKSDLILMGAAGDLVVWLMDGATVAGNAIVLGTGTGFAPVAIGDFDNNGNDDVVISHADGRITMWLMNGAAIASSVDLLGAGTGYTISHAGDFNNDLNDDLMLKGPSGEIVMWQMNGTTVANSVLLYGGGPWQISHVGDVNGDGFDDMVVKGPAGEIVIWEMNGSTITNSTLLYGGGPWNVTHAGDYNGDAMSDFLLRGPGGEIVVWIMNGSTITSSTLLVGATTWLAMP